MSDSATPVKWNGKKPTQWLVTGGCGFIGTSLIRLLAAEPGNLIRIVDNLSVGSPEDLATVCDFVKVDPGLLGAESCWPSNAAGVPCELVVGDIIDRELALRAAQGAEVIVHLAANTGVELSVKDPWKDCMANVIGTLNYLEAARQSRAKRFVFSSSGAPLGECAPPIHEEMPPHPVSPYGASKMAGEGYCSAYYRTFGIETVALRFGNVYGPGSGHKNSVVAKFIRRAMKNDVLGIYGDGRQSRDFIYIDDLVRAILLAASLGGVGGHIFQIATNRETTVAEMAETLVPILADFGHSQVRMRYLEPRQGDVRRNYADTAKARRMLKWEAEVGLEQGLRQTVAWFVQNLS